jgi:hypothetical protein
MLNPDTKTRLMRVGSPKFQKYTVSDPSSLQGFGVSRPTAPALTELDHRWLLITIGTGISASDRTMR